MTFTETEDVFKRIPQNKRTIIALVPEVFFSEAGPYTCDK
jgi:hypothetical protein